MGEKVRMRTVSEESAASSRVLYGLPMKISAAMAGRAVSKSLLKLDWTLSAVNHGLGCQTVRTKFSHFVPNRGVARPIMG